MLLRLSRIVAVLAAALAFAATSVPTNAEAHGFLLDPALLGTGGWGPGAWGGGPGWGGGGWNDVGSGGGYWGGCGCGCCQVWVPPPPPPCGWGC
jgi:hypothetical protein